MAQLQKEISVTATGDSRSEVGNLELWVTPEDCVFGTGGSSVTALGGGA